MILLWESGGALESAAAIDYNTFAFSSFRIDSGISSSDKYLGGDPRTCVAMLSENYPNTY